MKRTPREGTKLAAPDSLAGSRVIVCDLRWIGRADVACVDALARMQLAARQAGLCIHVVGASSEMRELLVLAGLDQVLPLLQEAQRSPEDP